MELFRASEALLRFPRPLLPFLAPAAFRPRPFTTSTRHSAEDRRDTPFPDRASSISSLLDSALDGTKGTPAAPATRTSRFKSNTAQQGSVASQYQPSPGSSVDEILQSMASPTTRHRSNAGVSRNSSSSNSSFLDIESLLAPNNSTNPFSLSSRANNPLPPSTPLLIDKPLPMKLTPSVGRAITVDASRGMDIGRAFRSLEVLCARNSVRKDFMRQRFHERPGLKRKRLKGERWRRRFKENFKGVVAIVGKMRAQGW